MPNIAVNIAEASYEVMVEPGSLAQIGAHLRSITPTKKVVIIRDDKLPDLLTGQLTLSLHHEGIDAVVIDYPASEETKSVEWAMRLYDPVLRARIDRRTPLLALGGGVTGDVAGFVAATVLRGLPFVQIPTTLLSMVDASVGGKTGVNHAVGKNLIGAFHQPVAVFIDPQVLATLPPRELRSGLAECIKHDIIRDEAHFAHMEQTVGQALQLDIGYLSELVAHNVAIKAKVVAADPFEQGERAHLNFGHTFGHAIETISKFSYTHGESIALGMVAASRAAMKLGMLDDASAKRIVACIAAAGLPVGRMTLHVDAIVEAMTFDKKVKSGKVRFVLPDRIGHVVIRDDVPANIVRDAVASLRG